MRSWRSMSQSPIPPDPRLRSHSSHAARESRSNASCALAEAEQRPVTTLRGVGPALAERLARLGIERVQDLLFCLPLRYEDRTRIVAIAAAQPGMRVAVEGEVLLTEVTYR